MEIIYIDYPKDYIKIINKKFKNSTILLRIFHNKQITGLLYLFQKKIFLVNYNIDHYNYNLNMLQKLEEQHFIKYIINDVISLKDFFHLLISFGT